MTRLALANPKMHIVLRHNGKLVHEIQRADLRERLAVLWQGRSQCVDRGGRGSGASIVDWLRGRPGLRSRQREVAVSLRERTLDSRPQFGPRVAGSVSRLTNDRPICGRVPVPEPAARSSRRQRASDEVRGAIPRLAARITWFAGGRRARPRRTWCHACSARSGLSAASERASVVPSSGMYPPIAIPQPVPQTIAPQVGERVRRAILLRQYRCRR